MNSPDRLPPSRRPAKVGGHDPQRLDPMGIYGTRSAHRRRSARRQRQWQGIFLVLLAILGLVAAAVWAKAPRVATFGVRKISLPLRPAAPPTLTEDGQTLLIPTQSGTLFALALQENSFHPRAILQAAFPLQAQPLADGTRVFAPCQDGTLYAADWKTGKMLWSHATNAALTTRPALVKIAASGATAALEVVIAANDDGQIFALEAASGKVLWSRALDGPAGNAITAQNGPNPLVWVPFLAGVASRGGLACLDAKTGAPRWKFPDDARTFGGGLNAPALELGDNGAAKNLFFPTDDGQMVCLDARSGRKIWKNSATPAPEMFPNSLISFRGAPVWVPAANVVIVGGNDGLWRAFDAQSGRLRWTKAGKMAGAATLTQREGHPALLVSDLNAVQVLDVWNGTPLAQWRVGSTTLTADSQSAWALNKDGVLAMLAPS